MKNIYCIAFTACLLTLACCTPTAWAWPEEGRAAISPTLVTLKVGGVQQFSATLSPRRMQVSTLPDKVTWSVNGIPGGNSKWGRIDDKGVYQAPKKTPVPAEIHIRADVPSAKNPFLFATVLIEGGETGYQRIKRWDDAELKKAEPEEVRKIALDTQGNLLMAAAIKSKVLQFTVDGSYVGDFGKGEDMQGVGHESMCVVAVDPDGRVLCGDLKTGPPRISVFKPDGNWLFGFAPKGAHPWMVASPSGLAFHSDGRIFVADLDGMRVIVFGHDGKLQHVMREHSPKGNRFNAPSDIAIDPAGDLFVPSTYGPCEKITADTAERLLTFASPEPPDGLMFIDDVCIDQWGNAFLAIRCAADPYESGPDFGGIAKVLKFNNHGDFITEIPLATHQPERAALAVNDQDELFIATTKAKSVTVEVYAQP